MELLDRERVFGKESRGGGFTSVTRRWKEQVSGLSVREVMGHKVDVD